MIEYYLKNNPDIFCFWWMNISKKLIPILFAFSDTFSCFLFLMDKSHLKRLILIFFVSDEWMIVRKNNT